MRKLYELELLRLNETYQWARKAPIEELCSFIAASCGLPLIAVGSGGSLTVAQMAALLHRRIGKISIGVTPLEFVNLGKSILDSSVLMLTSKGNNSDILSAFRYATYAEPRQLMALCMKKYSQLSCFAEKYEYVHFLDFELPTKEDGFLATNSLIASIILLIRAYNAVSTNNDVLSEKLNSITEFRDYLNESVKPLVGKSSFIVLYGYWGHPCAIDIESKFTEAALGNVQIADYRNFGHGRHHWLAKHGTNTGVIALVTPEDAEIVKKTLDLIPSGIPLMKISTKQKGPVGSLDLIIKSMHIVNLAGKANGINPGSPGVPKFGRSIYHLTLPAGSRFLGKAGKMPQREAIAILRKSKNLSISDMDDMEVEYWHNAYHIFVKNLEKTSFGGIVFDYDGTLCDADDRYLGPSARVVTELIRLLQNGLAIGIATGRGNSVKNDLRRLIQNKYWSQVLIGYYNCADIALLNNDRHPDTTIPMHPALEIIKGMICRHDRLPLIARFECRPKQIMAEAKNLTLWAKTRTILKDIVNSSSTQDIRILESDHSLDIIAPGVSKLNIITKCQQMTTNLHNPEYLLSIGDKGEWPGNDYELLSTSHSLSVGTVSSNGNTCWNLAKPGQRGTQATIQYLSCLDPKDGVAHFYLR